MEIPFLNLSSIHRPLENSFRAAFDEVLQSSRFILGEKLECFEKNYARYCSTEYCIGVGNGLDALSLSLRAAGVQRGDEVIVPAHTFIATFLAVSNCEAIPVPVDVNPESMNLDPKLITPAITSKTKVIIPVHLYGQACEMDPLLQIAKKNTLKIVEDNAQAQGAEYKKRRTGSFGIANAHSFYPGKNLGALGDGGAITCSDAQIASKLHNLRNYGSDKKYIHTQTGVNSRLDELQAAFLSVKLSKLDEGNKKRNAIANFYLDGLSNCGDLNLPKNADGCSSVYHLFVVRTTKRNELMKYLTDRGIGTMIHYPVPVHLQDCYKHMAWKKGDFPVSEEISGSCLSIPCHEALTEKETTTIVSTIKSFYHG